MKRGEFLRSVAGTLVAIPALRGQSVAGVPSLPVSPDDGLFWQFVREQFPLSHERAYLNTGGLGASPYAVIDAVKAKMDELELVSETGHTEALLQQIKTDAGRLFGCDHGELAFTRNTTEGINIIANGIPWKSGDEVILTTHEHVGNAMTWIGLSKREGVTLRLFEPSVVSDQENIDRLSALITRRTRLISIPHIVTTTGLIMPVREIAAVASRKGILFFVDGAQSAGMLPFNLHDIGCDAYATSGHKWLLGPKETGLLYVRKDRLDAFEARYIGAHSDGVFDLEKNSLTFGPTAGRYEYGTVSIPLRAGFGAALRFIHKIGPEAIWRYDARLAARCAEGLAQVPGIRVLSPTDPALRSAMVTFMHEHIPHLKVQEHLNGYNLRTRGVTEGGLAALRVSFHLYNSTEEVDRVIDGVRTLS